MTKKFYKRYILSIMLATAGIFWLLVSIDNTCIKEQVLEAGHFFTPEFDEYALIQRLNEEMEFVGTVIWTMTTILSGFVIMYYEMLGYRNFGLTNRMIIACICGSMFIPGLVGLNAVVVCMMTCMFYFRISTDFYILAIYSCFLQGLLIFFCVFPTSQFMTRRVIVKLEKRQFEYYLNKISESDSFEAATRECDHYIKFILGSDELLEDKVKLSLEIVMVPFRTRYRKTQYTLAALYSYEFKNLLLIASYMEKSKEDFSGMKELLFWTVERITRQFRSIAVPGKSEKLEDLEHSSEVIVFYGAFFNVFIPRTELENRWEIVDYIINDIDLPVKLKRLIVAELILSISFLKVTGQVDVWNETEYRKAEGCFRKISDCHGMRNYLKNLEPSNKKQKYDSQILSLVLKLWVTDVTDNIRSRWENIYLILQSVREKNPNPELKFLLMKTVG